MFFNTNLYDRLQNRLLLSQNKHANGQSDFPYTSYRPRPIWPLVPSENFFLWPQNRLMARSPERILEFWKQEKVTGSQIWRIRWLSNDFCFVFNQKFSHNQTSISHNYGLSVRVWRRRASYPKHEPQCVESIRKRF